MFVLEDLKRPLPRGCSSAHICSQPGHGLPAPSDSAVCARHQHLTAEPGDFTATFLLAVAPSAFQGQYNLPGKDCALAEGATGLS